MGGRDPGLSMFIWRPGVLGKDWRDNFKRRRMEDGLDSRRWYKARDITVHSFLDWTFSWLDSYVDNESMLQMASSSESIKRPMQ